MVFFFGYTFATSVYILLFLFVSVFCISLISLSVWINISENYSLYFLITKVLFSFISTLFVHEVISNRLCVSLSLILMVFMLCFLI